MSTFFIDGMEVIFPFPQAYPEQVEYMTQLKLSLDAGGPCILEMPSGTGKTVCLLSLIIAYMAQHENAGPLIYCTRTIPEMNQGIDELKRVNKCRKEKADLTFDKEFLAISLACRYYLCVNQEVSEQQSKKEVDIACRSKTIHNGDNHCDFYEHVLLRPRPGVYSLDDLRSFGAANGLCPYFLSKRLVKEATVIFCSFAYTLDPGASEVIMKNCTNQSIVVFDEAHNIDDVCCEFMSMFVDQPTLDRAAIGIDAAQSVANEIRKKEMAKLQSAFDKMKSTLNDVSGDLVTPETLDVISHPSIPDYVLRRAMPASIENFDDFVDEARKLVRFFTGFIQGSERPKDDVNVNAIMHNHTNAEPTVSVVDAGTTRYPPNQILGLIKQKCRIEPATLHFMSRRLAKFIVNNKIPEYEKFAPLFDVMEFGSLIGTYDDGFTVFVEETQYGPVLQMVCLDCTLAFEQVLHHFKRIVITSGTLSPLSFYPRLLNFEPVAAVDFTMSFSRQCLLPLIVSKGYMQAPITSSFKHRDNPNVAIGYGQMLLDYCKIVPDGIVGFFPSYVYMNQLLKEWMKSGIMEKIMKYKLVFIETANAEETVTSLEHYHNVCDSGKGAVLLGVARGRISEGIDFSDHYGRCCILFGLPVRNTQSVIVQARAEYIHQKIGITKEDFLVFDAMRAASQCVGRLLRSKKDYGVVVMADRRYAKKQCRSQMPHWINEFVDPNYPTGMTADDSFESTRDFMLQMAQPFTLDINKLRRFKQPKKTSQNTNDQNDGQNPPNEAPPQPNPILL